ncbi:peptidoglycan-binding domain-containing protein [Mesobacterium sp. TK19101]|uniref:Peptidoglycan-binding domain-containing protein n=1 Tax=Mesobacterium hydrothermale TaxID=3111907 RepID=A0ABU6HJG7_9RHOB|nr:peptidoglycan-binding domain-containing protein [Mesobacterium sp. TK19101]MEC3862257.1 peptidoglycan-binding domain-containing protein [Mesobacterium sp. TK19101]
MKILPPLAALLAVAACMETPATGDAASRNTPVAAPQKDSSGTCWAVETTPAEYEQVMGQVQVVPAQVDKWGNVLQPPIYRNGPVPKLVKPRGEYRFESPCPSTMTPEFLSSLQRALFARGYYKSAITGTMDNATRDALGRFQRERGLKSAQLSMDTARELGLVAVNRGE